MLQISTSLQGTTSYLPDRYDRRASTGRAPLPSYRVRTNSNVSRARVGPSCPTKRPDSYVRTEARTLTIRKERKSQYYFSIFRTQLSLCCAMSSDVCCCRNPSHCATSWLAAKVSASGGLMISCCSKCNRREIRFFYFLNEKS